jgi:putative membrane protein
VIASPTVNVDSNLDLMEVIVVWYMHGAGWGWWLLMSVGMVAFWAGVVYLVVWLVRGVPPSRRQQPTDTSSDPPLELLQRRLAAGEISVDEYNERRELLEGEPREPAHA